MYACNAERRINSCNDLGINSCLKQVVRHEVRWLCIAFVQVFALASNIAIRSYFNFNTLGMNFTPSAISRNVSISSVFLLVYPLR
jgi:hypothetical protein